MGRGFALSWQHGGSLSGARGPQVSSCNAPCNAWPASLTCRPCPSTQGCCIHVGGGLRRSGNAALGFEPKPAALIQFALCSELINPLPGWLPRLLVSLLSKSSRRRQAAILPASLGLFLWGRKGGSQVPPLGFAVGKFGPGRKCSQSLPGAPSQVPGAHPRPSQEAQSLGFQAAPTPTPGFSPITC